MRAITPLKFVFFIVSVAGGTEIEVNTRVGTFIGRVHDIENSENEICKLNTFLGIPYAEPPVGDLRFARPVPKAPLKAPMQTQEFGSQCFQNYRGRTYNLTDSEECLFLNIYAPVSDEKLPVMIWIHGGGFMSGSGNMYVADEIAVSGKVVVVTINYRLSVFGFLSTGDSSAPGNFGLWDQHVAIKWVHDNIQYFGGDPNTMTLFGESAGSASVIYQALFPGNSGLFRRIIAQSGSLTASWAHTQYPTAYTSLLASTVNCQTPSSRDMLKCLRDVDSRDLLDSVNNPSKGLQGKFPSPFLPCVDGEFVRHPLKDIFNLNYNGAEVRQMFSSFDLLTGINSGEGVMYLQFPVFGVSHLGNFLPNRTYFNEVLVPTFINKIITTDSKLSTALKEAVAAEYTDWTSSDNPLSIRDRYVDMLGDREFLYPMLQTLDLQTGYSSKGATYAYYLDAGPITHVIPTPAWFPRANHADDLKYLFPSIRNSSENGFESDWERVLSRNMITLWTNFAKSGNPNQPDDIGLDWTQYTKTDTNYLNIAPYKLSMKRNLNDRAANFWLKVIPSILDIRATQTSLNTCDSHSDCKP